MFVVGNRLVLTALLVCFVASTANAQFNRHRRRGTIIGGVAGAAIGAAIGDRRNNEAVGAVIGGVAGAVIGGNVGANKDHRIENSQTRYYNQPHYPHGYPVYTQPVPQPVPVIVPVQPAPQVVQVTRPISLVDVLNMLRSGLSENTIAAQIQRNGMSHSLTINDIISLHQQGVSEQLIEYMQASVVHTNNMAPVNNVQPQSRTSYSMPSQQPPVEFNSVPGQLNHPSGQSIMAPPIEFAPVN